MQILSICNKPPFPSVDGGTLAMASMIKSMVNNDNKVTCLFFATHKHPFDEKKINPGTKKGINLVPAEINTEITFAGALKNLISGKSYHISRFDQTHVHERLKELLMQNRYDIIQLESLFTLPYIKTIRQYSNAPVIYRAHNIETEIWEQLAREETNPAKKAYLGIQIKRLRKFEDSQINAVDGILAISGRDAEKLRNKIKNNKPVAVIPFGLDERYFKNTGESINQKNPSFFYIGAMDWMPNIESVQWLLEKVWPEVTKKFPEIKLIIAGKQMPEYIKKFENKQVEIAGQVDDAIQFMHDNVIMLAPLFSGSGIRIKILEAMALGKTVITTSTGAMGIDAKHHEHILISNDRETFIREIEFCLENVEATKKIGENAREFALKNYSISSISEQLKKYYQLFV
jgi:glycosyltransferase involved in cell wall biosynthesis